MTQRNTLKKEAVKAHNEAAKSNPAITPITDDNAGTGLHLLTVQDIANINVKCYADCSSLMTFCAVAGGADFSYDFFGGGNAPTCSKMKGLFTKNNSENGPYMVLTDSKYLTSGQYLQYGDILVNESQHTVMVLANGDNIPVWEDPVSVLTVTKVAIKLTELSANMLKAQIKIVQAKDGFEELLEDNETLKLYKWRFSISSLDTLTEYASGKMSVNSPTSDFAYAGLKPDSSYILSITAENEDGSSSLKSSNIIFTTPQSMPTSVSSLKADFSGVRTIEDTIKLTFNKPSFWGNPNLTRCYRLSLIVNGRIVAYSDSILKTSKNYNRDSIALSAITNKQNLFNYKDTIQLGVQPGLKDSYENFIFDPSTLSCTKPFYVGDSLKPIDKIFVNIKNTFKRAIVYK